MTREQLIEFLDIIGVRYELSESRRRKDMRDVVVECPFARWTHEHGIDRRLGNASIRIKKLPHLFHCFSCKTGSGPLNIMVKKLREFGFDSNKCDRLDKLLESAGELDFNLMDKFAYEADDEKENFNLVRMQRYIPASSAVFAYLAFRDVDTDMIEKYEIMEWDDYMALPLKNNRGEIVGVAKRLMTDHPKKKRWVNETTSRPELCLYGEQFADVGDDVIIVEGQIDVLYMDGLIPGTVVLGANGSSLSEYQEFFLRRMGSITVMTDEDEAGKKLKKKIKKKLYKYIPLMFEGKIPKEYNDPANTPKDILVKCFEERKPLS